MTAVFDFHEGDEPLLVSIPHDGRALAPGQAERMTEAGRALPDTDWHVKKLYAFATQTGASVIAANYSRYVVDLNRPGDDAALYPGQTGTGLIPEKTFDGRDLYLPGEGIAESERGERIEYFWQPYHDKLAATLEALHERHGIALLWDAHSIMGEVPTLFDGRLPDLNVGTNGGASCGEDICASVMRVVDAAPFSSVLNGRFKGGYITRHYGRPAAQVHAIQLEIAQRSYMDEESLRYDDDRAGTLIQSIRAMLRAFLAAAEEPA